MNPALQDSATPPCVLIVDDDPLVLRALETTMLSADYHVVATEDPLAGLQCLRERRISVIIADQRMDAMSGLELLAHARELQPHASRILITGLLSVKMLTDAVNGGEIYRFIAKPWSTPDLLATVHNAEQRYHLLCENAALQAETQRLNQRLLSEKQSLEACVSKLTTENEDLHRALTGLRTARGHAFDFCDALLRSYHPPLAARTRRTVAICQQLAEAAALPAELREDLLAAAWYHDLGLLATAREAEQAGGAFRDHPAVSEHLVRAAGLSSTVEAAVRAHHESYDGSGFPDHLRGRQIPEVARWLTPVAYYVSCGLSRERALEELEHLAGAAFDPQVVPFLLRLALVLPSPDSPAPLAPPGAASPIFPRSALQARH